MAPRGEFQMIGRFFTHPVFGAWRSQGVGDDCALVDIGAARIAVTTDMEAVGTHFLPDADPRNVGWKSLAVNLSDLAAAGARPRTFFLSIGLPSRDDAWLAAFSDGMMELAHAADCALLGGDTTRTPEVGGVHSPACIVITAMGELDPGTGLTRAGGRPGDEIWISGTVGGAYAGLKHRWGHWTLPEAVREAAFGRMDRPQARWPLGQEIVTIASACADISDGLAQDLGHILERSGVDAVLRWPEVPVHESLASLSEFQRLEAALRGGDDYELVFTAPADRHDEVLAAARSSGTPVSCAGFLRERRGTEPRLTVLGSRGKEIEVPGAGFDHFAENGQ